MSLGRTGCFVIVSVLLAAGCSSGMVDTHDGTMSNDGSHDAIVDGRTDTAITDASSLDANDIDADDGASLDVVASDVTRVPDARDVASAMDVTRADVPAPPPCTTRITYGNAWIHGPGHPTEFDDADGVVTWDGACTNDGTNSYAVLSNGWRPYFTGHGACVLALDYGSSCTGVPSACETRVTYGSAWMHGPGHAAQYDDTGGVVNWDTVCRASGSQSFATLSNGWTPYFTGTSGCSMSFRYVQCGGLYANPVVAADCPDPGVVLDGDTYVMACTSGGAAAAFPIRTSRDLVHWTSRGHIFPSGSRPSWASGDFWAPEIHHVGTHWVAYYSARDAADGSLAIGAASGPSSLGPFTDLGHPLIHDPTPGVIDVSEYQAPDGTRYLLWKTDGNAVGARTPIHIQRLAADGLSLVGSPTTLITNDRAWEGGLVEGPWMIDEGGMFYLFYSANGYASPSYAIGVARASSPTGPFTKSSGPILVTKGGWAGPGHGSVVRGPGGEWVHVYHAWVAGRTGMSPGREVLVDRITWNAGWPEMLGAPSTRSLPPP